MKWWQIVLIAAIVVGGIWAYRYFSIPAPGQRVEDLGREHVSFAQVESTNYNSNPPTSGPHLATWVKPGIFDKPLSEGELIHSLEHGYIVISYNCNVHLGDSKMQDSKTGRLKDNKRKILTVLPSYRLKVSAHEEEGTSSAGYQDSPEATGSAVNESDACKTLVNNLSDLAKKKKLWKLVVVPRPQLDTTIALTAWNYIDKFDPPAGGFDAKRIERFIDYHRDHGPEQTME